MDLNLLTQPLISTRSPGERGERLQLTLPAVLAHLGRGEELDFPSLRPHQEPAWHAFLVQLGALVTHQLEAPGTDLTEESWRHGLSALAGDAGDAAWSLLVSDLALPAFMQNPVPEGSLAGFKKTVTTPDDLDVLITARNHDVKQSQMSRPGPEHWIYALITLQTSEGFLGRGNYGIARMNGGFASRPSLGYAPGLGWSGRFRRDVAVWRSERDEILRLSYGYPKSGGTALLWVLAWDGKESRATLSDCDPYFLEVCRRIRLGRSSGGGIQARVASTSAAFLDAKLCQGDTGDAWTPVSKAKGSALSVAGSGFSYRLLSELLFSGSYRTPAALKLQAQDGEAPLLVAQVLARGQGKTEGFHRRLLPIPKRARRFVTSEDGRTHLAELARTRVENARDAQTKVLRPALCALLQGGREQLDFRDPRARPWLDRLDAVIDQAFFPKLWEDVEQDSDTARRRWYRFLREQAQEQLEAAIQAAPIPLAVYPRAVAKAEGLFWGLARKHFPEEGRPITPQEEAP